MAKKQIEATAEMFRKAFIANLEAKRKSNAETIVNFTEKELTDFIRQYADANFKGIYVELDHNYYDRISSMIPLNQEMKSVNEAAELKYSSHLKLYSMFLESKHFKQLFKERIASPNEQTTPTSGTTTPTPPTLKTKERELTEGEKKHVEYETAHRNPKLRQACLDKYGYQCQCCGMDFASVYGEELGANFIEVHHLQMISTYDENRPEDYVENLVPLCSNCHSMIHHGKQGPLSLRELREAYRGEKKPLIICKED